MSDQKTNAFHTLRSNLYAVGFCWRNAKELFFANLFDILFGGLFNPAYLIVTAALFEVLEQSGRFQDALRYVLLMALMLAVRIAWSQLYRMILKPVIKR